MSPPPVLLVGAGPGDPNLITVAGLQAVQRADVIVHDRLIPHSLLAAAPQAELVDAGKRPGAARLSQDEIHALLIDRARRGLRVVRLQGGDPFVFGRGGEEAAALHQAGLEYEIIPGVSSATAAAALAGIPVTDRRAASAFTVVTGHEALSDRGAAALDWRALGRTGGTLVVLMGWRNLARIVERLIDSGLDPDTPTAAVEQASTPQQRSVIAPLSELAQTAAQAGLRPPVTVVIGRVVALARPPALRPLHGLRVLVTRPREQADAFAALLREQGAEPILMPTIALTPTDSAAVAAAVQRLAAGGYDDLILTSVNGVERLWSALREAGRDARAFAGVRIGVIGAVTAAALADRGLAADLVPETYTSAALLAALSGPGRPNLDGRRILLARAAQGSRLLSGGLRERGALVDDVALYDTVTARPDPAALNALGGGIHVVALTSPSTARGLRELARLDSVQRALSGAAVASIGPVTAAAARELGWSVAVVAQTHTAAGLVEAIVEHTQYERQE